MTASRRLHISQLNQQSIFPEVLHKVNIDTRIRPIHQKGQQSPLPLQQRGRSCLNPMEWDHKSDLGVAHCIKISTRENEEIPENVNLTRHKFKL